MTEGEATIYQSKVTLLSEEHAKDQPSIAKIKKLMKLTFGGRRSWILTDMPQVHAVLEVFPAIKQSDRVRNLIGKVRIIIHFCCGSIIVEKRTYTDT